MSNPSNTTNLTVTPEIYDRLTRIKKQNDWTYNETINKLCELEFQHNYIEKTHEYVLITKETSRIFRVTFKKENMVIEYFNTEYGYDIKIGNWELDKKITNLFYEFIQEDYARCMLENLPISIEFKHFIIQKIG